MYIIPQPQEWKLYEGSFGLSYDSRIVVDRDCFEEAGKYAFYLKEAILSETGMDLLITKGSSRKAGIILKKSENPAKEEYRLTVDQNGVILCAGAAAGLLYAVQTLIQIMRQAGPRIPYMEIHDWPEIPDRGYYLDVTRSRIPTLDYLKKLVDKAAFYKLNQFQLYVEHSFLFENLSEVWRDDTPLTAPEILELDEYCRERNIELVPSVACFGHLYKVLRTKTFSHLCERADLCDAPFGFVDRMEHHTLDVSNPASLQLALELIGEYMDLFSSDKFNICGDETFDLGKGRSRKLAEQIGTEQMYLDFVRKLCEFLVKKGKTPMFWGDIISRFPERIKELPEGTICLNWGYDEKQDDQTARALSDAGALQYCCPGVRGWDQFVNEIEASYENIRRMCVYAVQYQAKGVLNTDWGDCGHVNHPDFGITGMIYGAAFSWNQEIPPFEEMNRRISRLEFTDPEEEFVSIIAEISQNWIYKWRNAVNYKENREAAFSENQFEELDRIIKNLSDIKNRLLEAVPRLDSRKRSVVSPYLTAVDGMILFQRLGMAVSEIDGKRPRAGTGEYQKLASDLENWFYFYKSQWRKVSKESELYQIQDVIIWYADLLRSAD